MSYIRPAWPLKYVDGISSDYIFECSGIHGKMPPFIEDYDNISDEGLVELCCMAIGRAYDDSDALFKEYLMGKLAERLKVRLRKKPLTDDEIFERMLRKK